MPKNLIVITKLFPYNFTEAFLESETPFLQEKFKNIIFMPLLKGSIRPNFSSLMIHTTYYMQRKPECLYEPCILLTCINHYSSTEEHCSKKRCS